MKLHDKKREAPHAKIAKHFYSWFMILPKGKGKNSIALKKKKKLYIKVFKLYGMNWDFYALIIMKDLLIVLIWKELSRY